MKLKYINWEKVEPGTIFGIKNTFGGLYSSDMVNYKYYYYFIKYDDTLNELVFYNVLDECLERIIIKSAYCDDIEFDILSGTYSYFDKPKYKYLKEGLSKNQLVIFKDTILKRNKSISKKYEFFKITKLKANICDLESISKGFKLKNIDINSITTPSKIFKFKKENLINMNGIVNIGIVNYKSKNFNLVIKIDECHRNIFVLVYDDITKKYSIQLLKPDILIKINSELLSRFNSISIINDCIEKNINMCIDSIENGYPNFILNKGDEYKRFNYKTNEEEEVKFNLKDISCFYDLYFENLFDIDQEIDDCEKESIKNFVNESSAFYK